MKGELQRKKMVGSKVRESIAQTKYSLAFWCKLAYTFFQKTKKVAKSLLGLPYMPARTLNDFLCGLFLWPPKKIWRQVWQFYWRAIIEGVIEGRIIAEKVI